MTEYNSAVFRVQMWRKRSYENPIWYLDAVVIMLLLLFNSVSRRCADDTAFIIYLLPLIENYIITVIVQIKSLEIFSSL